MKAKEINARRKVVKGFKASQATIIIEALLASLPLGGLRVAVLVEGGQGLPRGESRGCCQGRHQLRDDLGAGRNDLVAGRYVFRDPRFSAAVRRLLGGELASVFAFSWACFIYQCLRINFHL